MVWLGNCMTALLQRAQELGLASPGPGARPGEGLAGPEGVAWQKCFASFFDLLLRHLQTLSHVYRLAQEVPSSLSLPLGKLVGCGYIYSFALNDFELAAYSFPSNCLEPLFRYC
jgi:hypothetical protein